MCGVKRYVRVALDVPIGDAFDYAWPDEDGPVPVRGEWVLVPWASGRKVGLVLDPEVAPALPPERIRPVLGRLAGAPAPDAAWLALGEFAARYYHRPVGEVLLAGLPRLLRTPPAARARGNVFDRARTRWPAAPAGESNPGSPDGSAAGVDGLHAARPPRELSAQQRTVLEALAAQPGHAVHLLHGITGSGKTFVYLQWLADRLAADPRAQVLMLVPEIGLTPQLAGQLQQQFAGLPMAILHSDLPDGERAMHWLAAAEGRARVVVGTRLAVLTPLPRLTGIVVDEEHDPSYRQQEGIRYSARDLAIALAAQRGLPIVLGSATPSLESWQAAQRGRYRLHRLDERPGGGQLPGLRVIDMRQPARQSSEHRDSRHEHGLGPQAIAAIDRALQRGEQALVFLNRRGFAPVLACAACGWISRCDACTACRVLHRQSQRRAAGDPRRYRLVCHHCASEMPVPRACPECGNLDLQTIGQGTQRIEEGVQRLFPKARLARLDRDVARRRGMAETVLAAAHAGDVDILVGTQMLAKGHDFARLSVVVIVDADGGLYAADFRAPERLFATLMQVAGRAGRSSATGSVGEVIVQTRFPDHPLFAALARYDYPGFARLQLAEREQAGLPPFMFQALLRAEARELDIALAWLAQARVLGEELSTAPGPTDGQPVSSTGYGRSPAGEAEAPLVALYDPVPQSMVRVAHTERAQLLIESASRRALHAMVGPWLERLRAADRSPAADASGAVRGVRWHLEIDPLEI